MLRTKVSPHYFLTQFLPLAVLVLAAAGIRYNSSVEAELHRFQTEQRERVGLGAAALINDMRAPLRHLSVLSHERPIVSMINDPSPANLTSAETSFFTLMLRNPDYDQVRWIDERGMERLRVEMGPNGPERVSELGLHDKKQRHYFEDTMALPPGEMLVSAMDLALQNGRIAVPHKPTVRLALPVINRAGVARGILVINMRVSPMLDRFASQAERGNNRVMLLNGEGYWLYSTNSSDEWAFLFQRDVSMGKQYATVWSAIQQQAQGNLVDHGIWSWQRIELDADVDSSRYHLHQQSPWTVALYLPQQRMVSDDNVLLRLSLFVIGVLTALALLCWQLALTRRKREMAVHDRLRAEAELVASEQRVAELERYQETRSMLASIVSSSDDAIIGTSLDDIINSWNPGAEKVFGYLAGEVMEQSAYILVPPERTEEARNIVAQITQGETVVNFETVRWHKDGRLLDISVTVSPILDGHKKIVGTSYIARDITDRKQLEKEINQHRLHLEALVEQQTAKLSEINRNLELALSRSESATRAKSNFLSNMSHEIRTPMNAVLGLTYLLDKSALHADQRDLVRKIITAGQSLLGIINDILDVSKIEAGRLEIEHVPFLLSSVLEKVVNVTAPSIGSKDVELIVGFNNVGIEHLYGDALRLEQILINLTSNAIKFTSAGEISIRVELISRAADQAKLRFAVTDSGIGIPMERQQDIFQAFTQEDASTTRRYGGTGLGLTICRHLVQLMHGEIGLVSTPGRGSQFWFILPFQLLPQAPVISPDDRLLRVLVADDNATARDMLTDTVKSMGWQVDVVDSGEAAIQRLDHDCPYDLFLIDWRMTGMDGLKTARAIREVSIQQDVAPMIIMVTAQAREDLLQAPEAGLVDAVINKPVTPSTLFNTIEAVRQRRGEVRITAQAVPAADEIRISGARVLVVDDSEINREVARRILEAEGVKVFCADDGAAAVAWLSAHSQDIDLVLMDIQMPIMDGYCATQEIRNTLQLRTLPIIAVTAGAFKAQQEAALAAGMDGFLSKPYNIAQIVSVVHRHVAHLPRVASAMAPAASQYPARDSGHTAMPAAGPGIDIAVGLEAWGSAALYSKFLLQFSQQYGQTVIDIQAHIRAGELMQGKVLVHKLRGSAGTLALTDVYRLAGELEILLAGGATAADCESTVVELAAALQTAQHAIAEYAENTDDV